MRNFRYQLNASCNVTREHSAAILAAFLFVYLLSSSPVVAGPVLSDPELWDAGNLAGWTNTPPTGTGNSALSNPGSGGVIGDDGYLRISFGSQSGQPQYQEETIYTTNPDETENFQIAGLELHFYFYAEDVQPLSTIVYMHSDVSTSRWELAFTQTSTNTWSEFTVLFDYDAGWLGLGGAGQFWNDLADIDWIGINLARKLDTAPQDYGLDYWYYVQSGMIPEPGSVLMLASVLLSLAATFRKNLQTFFRSSS